MRAYLAGTRNPNTLYTSWPLPSPDPHRLPPGSPPRQDHTLTHRFSVRKDRLPPEDRGWGLMRTGLTDVTSGFPEKLMEQTPVSHLPQVPVSTLMSPLFGADTTSCPLPKVETTLKHKSCLKDLTTYADACRSTMPIGGKNYKL